MLSAPETLPFIFSINPSRSFSFQLLSPHLQGLVSSHMNISSFVHFPVSVCSYFPDIVSCYCSILHPACDFKMSTCSKFLLFVYLCLRTVVKCNIAKSQALYSAQRGLKTNNAAVLKVGAIFINIPQHPATLHSMMVRSSHQLSKQISDLIRQPSNMWGKPLHFLFVKSNDFFCCPC